MLKIAFFDHGSKELGSTRIWVYNLIDWFTKIGIKCQLNNYENLDRNDVIIIGKNFNDNELYKIKLKHRQIIGIINPSDKNKKSKKYLDITDFTIVGSFEEKLYYDNFKKNNFVFPLIEKYNAFKQHKDNKIIVFGYHGNKQHLEEFFPHLTRALEIFARERDIKLKVIYNIKNLGAWVKGKPKIDIEFVQFQLDTFQDELLECDIGLVPGLVHVNLNMKKIFFYLSKIFNFSYTGNSNDYLIRFKNTTNAGRAFVFHQLGIPVVSDLIPSNFHILANPDCGYLAHNTESWIYAFRELSSSAKYRQEIAINAKNEFNRLYNPIFWAKKLYNNIENLYKKINF